ncbi:phage virion morphogenesis protein [Bacteroidales bacterium OttesenSCG-928-C19]|nr:phage virion morphogenesis protein [Bacteroidales bacterium OttesenSCG-928-C19]
MSNIKGLSEFTRKVDALANAHNRLPDEVAAIAVRFTKNRFTQQDWYDQSREPWKPLKRKRTGRKSQTILVRTGRLKRSYRKIYADSKKVILGSDVPYAQIHNDGGTITKTANVRSHKRKTRSGRVTTVKSHKRKMNTTIPKRQFSGPSERLEREIFLHIETQFENALKK